MKRTHCTRVDPDWTVHGADSTGGDLQEPLPALSLCSSQLGRAYCGFSQRTAETSASQRWCLCLMFRNRLPQRRGSLLTPSARVDAEMRGDVESLATLSADATPQSIIGIAGEDIALTRSRLLRAQLRSTGYDNFNTCQEQETDMDCPCSLAVPEFCGFM